MNLLTNAAEAMDRSSMVQVATDADREWCLMSISDEGPGIEANR
jgi:signal transduction histidine kinase